MIHPRDSRGALQCTGCSPYVAHQSVPTLMYCPGCQVLRERAGGRQLHHRDRDAASASPASTSETKPKGVLIPAILSRHGF